MGFLLLDNRRRLAAQAPAETADWAITLTGVIDGPITANESDATQIGVWQPDAPYDDIDQIIKRITHEAWTIYFRPEADGSRQEIVVEKGVLYSHETVNEGAYTVTVRYDGEIVEEVSVPEHWFRSRYRLVYTKDGQGNWEPAASRNRPVVADVATLIANKLLPPFGDTGIVDNESATGATTPYTIMGPSSIQQSMNAGSERNDIGPVTEHQARAILYLLGATAGHEVGLNNTWEWAEAAASIPWHMRDEVTGKPVSIEDHPQINGNLDDQWSVVWAQNTGWGPDTAHQPALAYVPYILTGDLYYLEELQFQATWSAARFRGGRHYNDTLIISEIQVRGYAWTLRSWFQCAKISPAEDTSGVLVNKGHFETILEATKDWFVAERVDATEPRRSVFRVVGNSSDSNGLRQGIWQGHMLSSILGWAISMGFTSWQGVYDWKIEQQHAMISGDPTNTDDWLRWTHPNQVWVSNADFVQFETWGAAYDYLLSIDDRHPERDPEPDVLWWRGNENGALWDHQYLRGALAMAIDLGREDFRAAYDWLHGEMVAQSIRRDDVGSNTGFKVTWSWVEPPPDP